MKIKRLCPVLILSLLMLTACNSDAVTASGDGVFIGWGVGRSADKFGRPVDAVNAQEKYSDYGAWFIGDDDKKICLTFDEGYENGYTESILDTLNEKGVHAMFFVTYDYCKSNPELVQRMIDDGHIVGNHSYSHPSFPSISKEEMKEEIKMLHDYVQEQFNYSMSFFRFPRGEFSENCLNEVKECGYESVFWSFAYADWNTDAQPSADEAYSKITTATHCGAIYLLHAVSQANTDCLGDVIEYWQSQGYSVESLPY